MFMPMLYAVAVADFQMRLAAKFWMNAFAFSPARRLPNLSLVADNPSVERTAFRATLSVVR